MRCSTEGSSNAIMNVLPGISWRPSSPELPFFHRPLPPPSPRSHRKFRRTLCCALQFYHGFQYPATKPRSRNPRRISLVYFGSTYCNPSLSLRSPSLVPSPPAMVRTCPRSRIPGDVVRRRHRCSPSKTTCGNLVSRLRITKGRPVENI